MHKSISMQIYTNVDEFNEIAASEIEFRFVHAVDGNLQSFVHGH